MRRPGSPNTVNYKVLRRLAPQDTVKYEVLCRPGPPDTVKYKVLRRPGPPDTVNYEAFGLKKIMFELGVYVWRARGRQKSDVGPSGPRG